MPRFARRTFAVTGLAALVVTLAPALPQAHAATSCSYVGAAASSVRAGQTLATGAHVTSPAGKYSFGVDSDGTLTLRNAVSGSRIWANSSGGAGATFAHTSTGAEQLLTKSGTVAWTGKTTSACGEAVVDDGGWVALYADRTLVGTIPSSAMTLASTPTRVAADYPFASTAPWNISLGSGANYESKTAVKTAALLTGNPAVNSANWSISVYEATTSDPMATVTDLRNNTKYTLRIPANATTTGGTDKPMGVIQPDGHTAWEFYKMTNVSAGVWTSTRVVQTDLYGDGMADGARASGISFYIGLIRQQELSQLSIKHALAIGIPDSMLKYGQIWPARTQDSSAATTYTGPIPMGSMVAIPPSVNVDALNLTPEGKALAHALQDYGAYVLVRASTVALFCELSCDATQANNLHNDWRNTLFPLMRVVTNSTADNIAGGGIRRQAALAPVN